MRSFHPIKQQQQLRAVVACSFRKPAPKEGQPSKSPAQRICIAPRSAPQSLPRSHASIKTEGASRGADTVSVPVASAAVSLSHSYIACTIIIRAYAYSSINRIILLGISPGRAGAAAVNVGRRCGLSCPAACVPSQNSIPQ